MATKATTFPLKAWRRPYPILLFLVLLPILWLVGVVIGLQAGLVDFTHPLTLINALILPLAALAHILRKDHRRYAAGELTLTTGELRLTGDPAGPLRLSPREIRDMKVAEDMLLLRLRTRPTLLIHRQRLDAPLETVRESLEAWVKGDDGRDAEAVALDGALRQGREKMRVRIEVWAGLGAAVIALALLLLRWLLP